MEDTKLQDEPARLAALQRYDVMDTPPEAPFDKITSLVKAVLNVPIALISLVDTDRQWFKSCFGLDVQETARNISFCTHTIQSRDALHVRDATLDPRFAENPLVLGPPKIASYLGVPLQTPDGYNLGSLCAIDTVPREFDAAHIALLKHFAGIIIDQFEMRRIAQIDALTGTVSRRALLLEVDKAVARYIRHGRPSALVIFDIDHFKRVNDSYGHATGDEVLRAVSAAIATMIRPSDSFGRLGGEEFGVLLAETTPLEAGIAAERFRAAVETLVIAHDPPIRVTASFGLASLGPDCLLDGEWMEKADVQLYRAKRTGRNRCCAEDPALLDR
jgi:diguanylate cyclase (GGDEF)-like protein